MKFNRTMTTVLWQREEAGGDAGGSTFYHGKQTIRDEADKRSKRVLNALLKIITRWQDKELKTSSAANELPPPSCSPLVPPPDLLEHLLFDVLLMISAIRCREAVSCFFSQQCKHLKHSQPSA